jgi:hypothetical protein
MDGYDGRLGRNSPDQRGSRASIYEMVELRKKIDALPYFHERADAELCSITNI